MALLVTPMMLGHIFMAMVNPATRVGITGMTSGRVDRRWARHHYPRWYREHFGGLQPLPGDATDSPGDAVSEGPRAS